MADGFTFNDDVSSDSTGKWRDPGDPLPSVDPLAPVDVSVDDEDGDAGADGAGRSLPQVDWNDPIQACSETGEFALDDIPSINEFMADMSDLGDQADLPIVRLAVMQGTYLASVMATRIRGGFLLALGRRQSDAQARARFERTALALFNARSWKDMQDLFPDVAAFDALIDRLERTGQPQTAAIDHDFPYLVRVFRDQAGRIDIAFDERP
ncbi:hypothetical protein JS533_011600 [Bifidobacterium amazonense]|uniref:DUF4375 domain-containing protein n=1 Tax=Bifidobacterium amazonense TaxID=2809027 RepID=A0ABS9VY67_9BIFI|nr:hypothetical protein [Bifidobacterium amazonense]MCH9276904.1 hypothetical protein [Bifidobacterium amazonense]